MPDLGADKARTLLLETACEIFFDTAEEELWECWLESRNDGRLVPVMRGMVALAASLGIFSAEHSSLWVKRIGKCPGHDDEGGRNWCAYCGTMSEPEADSPWHL